GLEELMKMRPVSYQWKEHPEKGRQLGLIAQDLQQIVPEVVSEVDDAQKSLSVEYMALIPVLIASLQEQNHRNGAVATVAAGSGN
ncbi:MAG: tail fiber domain-containing protein, partial [Candidatus Krumholzibacteriota bacterium]